MQQLDISFDNFVGQKQTIIHRFNPSLKIICVLFLLVMTFLPTGVAGQVIIFIAVMILWFVSRTPARKMWTIIKSVLLMLTLIFIINWATYKMPATSFDIQAKHTLLGFNWQTLESWGWVKKVPMDGTHYWTAGQIWGGWVSNSLTDLKPITGQYVSTVIDGKTFYLAYASNWYSLSSQVLITDISVTLKIFLMITIVTILTNTTSTIQLTFGIEDILHPLSYLKLPTIEISTIISIAIRFVPSLLEEANRIMNAQASRGMDFKNGKLWTKAKAIVSLVVPMFSIAFKKADQLSDAIEARNFNPRYARTRYRNFAINWWHWVIFGIIVTLCVVLIMFVARKVLMSPFFRIDCFLI